MKSRVEIPVIQTKYAKKEISKANVGQFVMFLSYGSDKHFGKVIAKDDLSDNKSITIDVRYTVKWYGKLANGKKWDKTKYQTTLYEYYEYPIKLL